MSEPGASAVEGVDAAATLPTGAEAARTGARRGGRPHLLRRGIGLRLLLLILAFSSAVTLCLTGLQLYLDYRRDLSAIEARLGDIETGYGRSLAAGLWHVDVAQLELQLQGILRLPDIRAVEVLETASAVEHPLRLSAGRHGTSEGISREYPLVHDNRGEPRTVGTLRVEATLEGVYRRLWNTAEVILATQAVKTFLVSSFILYIVYRLVTRHLAEIARVLARFDLRRTAEPLRLERRAPGLPDELDQVVGSFNSMSLDLQHAWSELQEANAALEHGLHLRRRYEEKLHRQAYYDGLTGLPNRALLQERLHHAVSRAQRLGSRGALLNIDLDQFRNVNDTAGHTVGDELLKEAAARLAACIREQGTLARLGGDEFSVIIDELDHPASAERLAARVLESFSAPFMVAGQVRSSNSAAGS